MNQIRTLQLKAIHARYKFYFLLNLYAYWHFNNIDTYEQS